MNTINWKHNGKEMLSHEDFTDDCIGFIYKITYTNGQSYIGKKMIRSKRRLKPTKAQLAIRKNYKRVEVKDIPFVKYNGSTDESASLTISEKNIIELCSDKINLTYCELKHMIIEDVLCNDSYINKNILGKFFRGRIL